MINDPGSIVNHNVSSLGLSCSHWKQWLIQEVSIRPSLGQLDPFSKINLELEEKAEKAMTPHSSTLAWKIPWTEEPGRLQSRRSL